VFRQELADGSSMTAAQSINYLAKFLSTQSNFKIFLREFRNSQPWQTDKLTQSKCTYIAQPIKYYSGLVSRSPVTY